MKYLISIVYFFSGSLMLFGQCDREQDSLALLEMFIDLDAPNWVQEDSLFWSNYRGLVKVPNHGNRWDSLSPINEWYGVILNEEGCVSELTFLNIEAVRCFKGYKLPHLEILEIRNSTVFGNTSAFRSFRNLKAIDIGSNYFNGELEDLWLPELEWLSLVDNKLDGEIPNLSKVPKLIGLDLFINSFSGSLPNFENTPNLEWLNVCRNQLSGDFPDLSKSTKLNYLDIRHNNFKANLRDLSKIPNVAQLWVSSNNIEGEISELNGSSVTSFLSNNTNLSGCIPDFVCDFRTFEVKDNPLLPWQGDHIPFCEGEDQVGAPCDDGDPNTGDTFINEDCECVEKTTSSSARTEELVTVYPNPASDQLYINHSHNDIDLIIYSMEGKQVLQHSYTDYIDISQLKKGTYIIEIKTQEKTEIQKIMKL